MRLQLLLVGALSLFLIAADAPPEAAKKELDRLQGTWTVVALENDGKALSAETVKRSTFVVKGNRYTLKGGEDTFQGILTLDPTKKPRHIDASFVDADGKDKGKAAGIYELDADNLKIIWREQGKERPTDFSSKAGAGTRLIVLKRDKK